MKPQLLVPAAIFLLASSAASVADNYLPSSRSVGAPAGFIDACAHYGWLCSNAGPTRGADSSQLTLLKQVNARVNSSVRPVDDLSGTGLSESWSLPTDGTGDCEDYALLKYKRLVEAGFDHGNLALSVVLDKRGNNHVVLVARMESGDVVLDSLAGSVKPWNRTGYTFVAHQGFQKKSQWKVSVAGPRARQLLKREAASGARR
ncbi:transglutaminase-like cysteine peptidase [Arvimicrobium flavum]|uniref:transglutaminase-like cysteine peptidase n=1 Tax=Arvimicrobium flavum TaxID=3393320 RepID=UPI00237B48F2|nr:transglutaminase-like cysteine peptidase [Mesorhizobium shangrilense]